ncbi:uncharacterized protein Wdr33 isoform X2 [Planococcus citri]|uniref:uncharacterized protein Wdr33 isoform X2 n=1 Tax=Planococcus citri TaxID=170843 RepID=UPI0031F93F9B
MAANQMYYVDNHMQHDLNAFRDQMPDYSNQSMEKIDDKRHKEQLQESLQIQQIQTEPSATAPQPYQFQGPMPLQLKHAFRPGQKPSFPAVGDPDFDGRRLRRTTMRKTVDYNAAIIRELENRLWQRDFRDRDHLQPDSLYVPHVLPPPSYPENPFNAVTTRFVKTATNKVRCPVFCLAWTPEGRRLITGTSSGEFTLWNGLTFNFETILQAHDCPVRTMVWSNNELWMLTGDHSGYIKYWQSNMNNVKMYQGHREAVRGVSFSPTDNKFVSCSDDGTVRLWDFVTCNEERIFRGHGADVKCVHWHPYKSLVASGSKDNQQPVKLWDPRSGKSMATIHAHKATVMDIKWNQNGNWVATASRDHLIKLYDIRNLNTDLQTFRGHKKETSVVAWHPQHEGLMCSGGSDGSILFWHVGTPKEVAAIDQAHDSIVWALAWHPLGHILCSGSNDHSCKFWTRNHPGDPMRDKYNLNTFPASILGFEEYEDESGTIRIPGMGPEDKVDISKLPENIMSSIPGLDSGIFKDKNKTQKKVPYAKPIPKNFQAQWNEQRSSKDIINVDESFLPDAKMMANKLFEHAPGAINVKDLKIDMMYIYGRIVSVSEGSEIERNLFEGRDRLVDYVNNGRVPELNDVIPHTDPAEMPRRLRALSLFKTKGRQVLHLMKKPEKKSLKRSRDTSSSIPNKKWRSDKYGSSGSGGGSDYRNSGGNSYSNKDYSYNDSSDYRLHQSSGGGAGSGKDSSRGGKNDADYDDYDNQYDYDDGGADNYSNERSSGGRNYSSSRDSWKDDNGGYQGRYSNSDRRSWSKGPRSDYSDNGGSSSRGRGYRQDSQNQSSHSDSGASSKRGSRDQSVEYGSGYQNDSRGSRFDKSTRSRRGSGFTRRPFGSGSRSSGGDNSESSYRGRGSRFSDANDRYDDKDDEYYDRGNSGASGGGSRDKDDYYDNKWQDDNRDDFYDSRYDGGGSGGGGGGGGNNNDDYYDDYQDDNSSGYSGTSRGGRFQSRGRGENSRGRRNSYGRGGPSSWRGQRGGKDLPPRRSRGRGPRRGM